MIAGAIVGVLIATSDGTPMPDDLICHRLLPRRGHPLPETDLRSSQAAGAPR